jgi:primosomal protein N' (replication factor Y)
MPTIELVDLKDKYFRKKNDRHFSDVLIEVNTALSLGEQVILFQNRRGYSPLNALLVVTCHNASNAM